jgi:aldehyde:ferredoxin oxidoreductase
MGEEKVNEELKSCGWRELRKRVMHKVHEGIRKKELELGRELTEPEFRETMRTILKEELRKAFTECGAI